MSNLFNKENIKKWNSSNNEYQIEKNGCLKCVTCNEYFPKYYFGKRSDTKRGYNMQCKKCYNIKNIKTLSGEFFKDCDGFEKYLQVSNLGRIITKERVYSSSNGICIKQPRILHQRKNKAGYLYVTIHIDGKTIQILSHRIIAKAFVENKYNYNFVNHKNEIKDDNRIENLEWCTIQYNNNYGTRNSRISKANKGKCSNKTKKRLANIIDKMKTPVIQLDIDGNFIQAFESISCAQKLLNNKGIASCICRKKYISKGFIFKQIKKECFLAIAALRDDTDKNQWFIHDDSDWNDEPNIFWYKCESESINDDMALNLMCNDCRKATVEELIKKFSV